MSLGVCGSRGPFGHKAELAVRILGDWITLSLTSEDEDETNDHFTGLNGIKPQCWTYKFILCLLCCWRAAKSLICCPHIVVCVINGALNFPLKHDTVGLSSTIKEHNDISSFLTTSHFTTTLVTVSLTLYVMDYINCRVVVPTSKIWKHHYFHATATHITHIHWLYY